MNHPDELKWIEGDLPDVSSVPYDCRYVAWIVCDYTAEYAKILSDGGYTFLPMTTEEVLALNGKFSHMKMVMPHRDSCNPLRWCDGSGMPIGYMEKVTYYAVIKDG